MAGLLVSQQFAQLEQSSSVVWQTIRLLLMFGLVVFLAVITTRLWVKKGAGIATGPKHHLRLLEHLPLGAGKGLCLVKVLDTVLLVSVTNEAITVLQEFPMSPEFDFPANAANSLTVPAWLSKLWSKGPASIESTAGATKPPEQPDQGFARELRQRLQRLKEPKL